MHPPFAPFAPSAFKHPLLLGDPDVFRRKIAGSSGLLRGYWDDFTSRCRTEAWFHGHNVFLLSFDDAQARAESTALLRTFWRELTAREGSGGLQFHTWCVAGEALRRIVYVDWLASQGAWTEAELDEAADAFIGFGLRHVYPTLLGRGRSSNNQVLSLCLYLCVAGFAFGWKWRNHATARFLFSYAWQRLPDVLGLFPRSGYGGEGSTYTSHVNTGLAFWLNEFVAQVTGTSWLDVAFQPNRTTLRSILGAELRCLGPNGHLLPWDHYGWQRAINASPFAYLARVTGEVDHLALIPALGLWRHPGALAWGHDDQLWTLVWWPDQQNGFHDTTLPAQLFSWFDPDLGAALDDPLQGSRLVQVWDRSAATIAQLGRVQTNPNHLCFECCGEPVFEDGIPLKDTDPWRYPPAQVLSTLAPDAQERLTSYLRNAGMITDDGLAAVVRGVAPGLIGSSCAIVVDDEGWYWPGGARQGRPEFHARSTALQAVAADAAAFYQPHYDVSLSRRSSLWTSAGFGLVVDRLEADSEHLWTWQAYLRPATELHPGRAIVSLSNGRRVCLAWEAAVVEARLVPVADFPARGDTLPTPGCAAAPGGGSSVRLELRRRGRCGAFAVALLPDATEAVVRSIGQDCVEVQVHGQTHRFVVANLDGRKQELFPGCSTTAPFAWAMDGGALEELSQEKTPQSSADIDELSDILTELPEFDPIWNAFAAWSAADDHQTGMDQIFAQLQAPGPDPELIAVALEVPDWQVRFAAIEVAGRLGLHLFLPRLRELLDSEHRLLVAELYPTEGAAVSSHTVKRWRIKAVLIRALGLLHDREAVGLLGRILRDNHDFYVVNSVAAQALGRIGGAEARAALAPALAESELNTRQRAEFALHTAG